MSNPTSKPRSQFTADEALKVSDQYDYLRSPNAPCSGSIYHAMWALADEVRRLRECSSVETSCDDINIGDSVTVLNMYPDPEKPSEGWRVTGIAYRPPLYNLEHIEGGGHCTTSAANIRKQSPEKTECQHEWVTAIAAPDVGRCKKCLAKMPVEKAPVSTTDLCPCFDNTHHAEHQGKCMYCGAPMPQVKASVFHDPPYCGVGKCKRWDADGRCVECGEPR